jgi:hypothetical protein
LRHRRNMPNGPAKKQVLLFTKKAEL